MKTLKLLFVASILLFAVSCSEEDSDNQVQSIAVNNNDSEEQAIPLNALEQGFSIVGAEKLNEAVPTPNGGTSFEIENTQSAFLNAGFEFELEVPSDYAGSYIQIQSADGSQTSDSYFDVPVNRSNKVVNETRKRKGLKFISQTEAPISTEELNNTEEIRVNFNEQVPAGRFCYVICVYDQQGNISLPQTVCIEVEAWGGNNEIVGSWNFVKEEEIRNGSTVVNINVNEQECESGFESSTLQCENGESLSYTDEYCYTTTNLVLNINADGSQSIVSEGIDQFFDFDESRSQCRKVITTENDKYDSTGNWAYDEEESKITFVEFAYTETVDGVVETNEEGDEADFGFDVELVSVTNNTLIVQFSDTYEDYNPNTQQSETVTEVIKYFFEK